MSNVREVSDQRVASLEKLASKKVSLPDLDHMKDNEGYLDIDKARSWIEVAAAERITKDPRRQSCDENEQLKRLQILFPEITKPEEKTFLYGGNLIQDKSQIPDENPSDIDAIMEEDGWSIIWTLKGGQEVDGTNQNRQFLNVINTIAQAPSTTSAQQIVLAVLVNGNFWVKPRKKYRELQTRAAILANQSLEGKSKGEEMYDLL